MKAASKAGGLAFTGLTGLPSRDIVATVTAQITAIKEKGADLDVDDVEGLITKLGSFVEPSEKEPLPAHIHAFHREFRELLQAADIDRLVVAVDDLDRCLPKTAIKTLEAIRLFLFMPGCAFVIATDEAMIEYAVRSHFPDLPLSSGPSSYARNYLEKLIQVPVRLPPLGYVETHTYLVLLLVAQDYVTGSVEFDTLLDLGRQALRRPWTGTGLTRTAIGEALTQVPPSVEEALKLAEQLARPLVEGAQGNPRQIKRFLNTLRLRLAIASARGIEDDIRQDVLGKLMLAERYRPDLFDQIAAEAALDGMSDKVRAMEKSVDDARAPTDQVSEIPASKPKKRKAETVKTPETETLSPWEQRCVGISPKLSEIDLRPYLFVSRDRKALFQTGELLTLSESWIEKLCGNALGAKAAATEVAKLGSDQLERTFNLIVAKVRNASDITTKPDGINGLVELCKIAPSLQLPTVRLLAELPVKNLGP